MGSSEIILGIGCFAILIAWYILGKMNNIIGLFFRAIWNFWMKMFSYIPFLGWMSHFIITMNEKDKINKREFQEHAAEVREKNAQIISEYNERKSEAVKASEENWKRQQQQQLQDDQNWVRKQAWQKEGRMDVEFSSDGKRWKYQDESWDNSRNV